MKFKVALLAGDGVGPEVVAQGLNILGALGRRFGHRFDFREALVGGIAIDTFGQPLQPGAIDMCARCHAVLLGAVGGPKWDDPKAPIRPEQGLLALRKGMRLFANLRPVKTFPQLLDATSLKPQILDGVDLVVVRELTGGLYFARPKRTIVTGKGRRAVDTLAYYEGEIERVVRTAFELARSRRKKLASIDKANILESSRLWRQVVQEVAQDYPDVKIEHVLVDTCAMRLVQRPASFDVIVTENMFGDILTDEAAVLAGSMGMLPSASLGEKRNTFGGIFGMYEPVHGSAPDIAGQDKANPIATILSIGMMLRHSLTLHQEAKALEEAVAHVLEQGYRTQDIAQEGAKVVGTQEMGELIASYLD